MVRGACRIDIIDLYLQLCVKTLQPLARIIDDRDKVTQVKDIVWYLSIPGIIKFASKFCPGMVRNIYDK